MENLLFGSSKQSKLTIDHMFSIITFSQSCVFHESQPNMSGIINSQTNRKNYVGSSNKVHIRAPEIHQASCVNLHTEQNFSENNFLFRLSIRK